MLRRTTSTVDFKRAFFACEKFRLKTEYFKINTRLLLTSIRRAKDYDQSPRYDGRL